MTSFLNDIVRLTGMKAVIVDPTDKLFVFVTPVGTEVPLPYDLFKWRKRLLTVSDTIEFMIKRTMEIDKSYDLRMNRLVIRKFIAIIGKGGLM